MTERDEQGRPRPRYGELAPEGWVWTPPEEAAAADDADAAPTGPADHEPDRVSPHAAPSWDRPLTLLLLIAGILGMFFNVAVLRSAPEAIDLFARDQGLGAYTASDSVPTIIAVGVVLQIALLISAATASIPRLVRRRLAFPIPLVAGVLAFLVDVVVMAALVATDPSLVSLYQR